MKYRFVIFVCALLMLSCAKEPVPVTLKPAPKTPPEWSKEAVWYQIMVERFHNGDPSNDPTIADIQGTYPGFVPSTWHTTPWTQDWYQEDDYFADVNGKPDFNGNVIHSFDAKIALRRYGGDLQGVLDKLDYLQNLGINAIYFNPINDAPSLHKYDARHWRHVDVNFGPDPVGDREQIDSEDPADPSSWTLTSADALFLELIQQAKARNIRIILDYSWNHTGHTFWAWRDVLEKQQESDYADWYWVKNFDDPNSEENEFEYKGWFGVFDLPEIQETEYADHSDRVTLIEGDIKSETAKSHILAVTRRWLDPNGDGDPSDGVDGFRLDVAAELPLGFWRDYRTFVKSINPEAYLVGEIWWEKWPDDLFDPAPVLQGDVFDAVMNYRWYREARHYFALAPTELMPSEFVKNLGLLSSNISSDFNYAMMNMSASHDSPRLLTSMFNRNKYKFNAKASADKNYKINKPNAITTAKTKLLLAHQFTYIGAPQIWAGDEMGMWGSDDPHNRKPLIWPEYTFANESGHPLGRKRPSDEVKFNQDLFDYYQFLVKLRRANPVLSTGEIEFVHMDDSKRILSYRRFNDGNESAFVVFNTSKRGQEVVVPSSVVNVQRWQVWRSNKGTDILASVPNEQLILAPESVTIILAVK
jgi:glycosidase